MSPTRPVAALLAAACAASAAATAAPEASVPVPSRPAEILLSGPIAQGGLVRGQAPAGTVELLLDGSPIRRGADGRFLIGFDRDHGPAARLAARLADGRTVVRDLAVAPRDWRVQHIPLARRPGGASEDFLRRREGELARIAAARARDGGAEGWRQRFVWPARGWISGVFGSQRVYRGERGAFHSGVDVAAGAGAPVVAPADGVVVLAGPPAFSLEGNLVIVDHGLGLNSAFLHLATVSVAPGMRLRQGDPIGTVGATGRATGPHLHWSMKWRDARIDPAAVAGAMAPASRPEG